MRKDSEHTYLHQDCRCGKTSCQRQEAVRGRLQRADLPFSGLAWCDLFVLSHHFRIQTSNGQQLALLHPQLSVSRPAVYNRARLDESGGVLGFCLFYFTTILKSRHPLPPGYTAAVTFVYLHFSLLSMFLVEVLGDRHESDVSSVRWKREASLWSQAEEAIGDFQTSRDPTRQENPKV